MMRRKDREVTGFENIVEIIDACDIVRIGLADGDFPYIVPVNFGYSIEGEKISLYFHGAMAGRKYELIKNNPLCSFEMDIPLKLECLPEEKDVTMRYKSVMGTGKLELLEGEEKEHAVDAYIMGRYPQTRDFAYNKGVLPNTAVYKLTVQEITAKANI